jgi:hypothetical protein
MGLAVTPLAADDSDWQQWTTFKVSLPSPSNKWEFGVWSQVRFDDNMSNYNWTLINPSAHYKLKNGWKVGFGYQYISKHAAADETMPWQEVSHSWKFSNRLVLGNRFRLEQRIIDDVSGVVFRGRFRINASYPIGKSGMYLTGSEAVWWNMNEKENGPKEGFDQNRLFGGLGWHVGKKLRFELGYQWRRKRGGHDDNVLMMQFFLNAKGKTPPLEPSADDIHH